MAGWALTSERQCYPVETRQTRKLQASKPNAAIPDIAASGLLINCHARIRGTDFLMVSNGISLSTPQRAIM